jgi:hypothetical protein
MNNFSDITVIDTADQLLVRLCIVGHGKPYGGCRINDTNLYIKSGENLFEFRFDLLETVSIGVEMVDPCRGALEIVEFSVNGLEVLPRYLHLASTPTTWIDQPGLWYFVMPGPFYPWYHGITGQGFIA